jgi:hypothetical protein
MTYERLHSAGLLGLYSTFLFPIELIASYLYTSFD